MHTYSGNPTANFVTGLIKVLWERSLKPEHFIAGFRATGLFPVCKEAIPARKMAASVPFATPPTSEPAPPPTSRPAQVNEACTTMQLKCTGCGSDMTPVKLHVVAYFTKHMQAKQPPKTRKDNHRVKPTVYGEVLTRDEIVERLEEQAREKREKEAEKAAKKTEKEAEKAAKKTQMEAKKAERMTKKAQKEAERAAKQAEREAKQTQKKSAPKPVTRRKPVTRVEEVSDEEEISKFYF